MPTFPLGFVVFCLFVQAPAPPPQQPLQDFVFRSVTKLVQVNVVVHDHQGNPVADLKKEDFSVTEKGKKQEIAFFSMESLAKLPTPAPKLPPHVFTNQLAQQSGVPSSVTVILLDSLNTRFSDQVYARKAVIEFLLQLKPTDHIAIYQLGRRLRILHDYTTDSAELIDRLVQARAESLPDLEGSSGFDLSGIIGRGARGAEAAFYTTDRVLNTLTALEVIANHLSSVQGRKNLIWLSDGFPVLIGFNPSQRLGRGGMGGSAQQRDFTPELNRTIRSLNNAGVAVYAVDAHGLIPPNISAQSSTPPRGGMLTPINRNFDSMVELADHTGGHAYQNRNDLKNAIREAIGDSEITYNIGYHPTEGEMDGKFRDIKVKVDRPGVNVRYRKGYYALSTNENPEARKAELTSAVWSPLDATALSLFARVDLSDQPQPNTARVIVQVDPSGLSIEPKNDRYSGRVDVFMVQKTDRGEEVGKATDDTLDLNLKPETYQRILKQGLVYQKAVARESGASVLRIVVRDTATGAIGTVTVPFKAVN